MDNVTAVVVNWLTARRTVGAMRSFRGFYPNIPLLVVDDASDPKNKPEFFHAYGRHDRSPELEYNFDNDKIIKAGDELGGVHYLPAPDFGIHPKSHGRCVDLAIALAVRTTWMFHFHSDYRMTRHGMLEDMLDGIDERFCGVGGSKTRHPRCPAMVSVAALYNVNAGRRHKVTFQPVIYYNDDSVDPFPGPMDNEKEGGVAIEAGSYFVGRLSHLGYKIKWMPDVHSRYGVHMRWEGDLDKWNRLY